MDTAIRRIHFSRSIPYYAQVASPELAEAIFSQGMDPSKDPHWMDWGFTRQEEYAYWVGRACGIVCVKMVVEALGGPCRSIQQWVKSGLDAGGYLVEKNPDGTEVERGWVHRALADLIREEGFYAQACKASLWDLSHYLEDGKLAIASVSYEIGTDNRVTRNNGHLVVVSGLETKLASVENYIVQNPSGRRAELQTNALIPAQRFSQAFSGRIILAGYASKV